MSTSSPEEPQTGPRWPTVSPGLPSHQAEIRPGRSELRLAVAAARAGGAALMRRLRSGADLEVPDSVYFLQHRPETTWATAEPAPPAASPVAEHAPGGGFDPVQYALRNVFKVPGS